MKVIHVITGLGTGGAEMMLYKLLKEQLNGPVEHCVICLGKSGKISDEIKKLGIDVHILGAKSRVYAPMALFKARKIIKQHNPDVIQGWMYDGNLAASLLSLYSNVSLAWNVRHSVFDINVEPIQLQTVIKLGAWFSHYVDVVIYNSNVAKNQHVQLGYSSRNSCIVPNGFEAHVFKPDPEEYVDVRRQLNIDKNSVLIGMVARFHPMKNHQCFIKAAAIVKKANENVRFVLVGNGLNDSNIAIVQTIQKYGLSDVFHLLDERHDMSRINASFDLSVSSSAWGEGFPNVLGEAMLCEVPCISTDVGDTALIIGDTGAIIDVNSASALADAMEKLINNKSLRQELGKKARQRIIDNFSLSKISETYKKIWVRLKKDKDELFFKDIDTVKSQVRRPNFFIIGAPKCGTTALAYWLSEHEQVHMAAIKEPHYFNADMRNRIIATWSRYQELFLNIPSEVKAIGEASVWYLYSDISISNIQRVCPQSKFIVLIRNPIDMAVSLYQQKYFNGEEPAKSFEEAWRLQDDRKNNIAIPWSSAEPRTLLYGNVCKLGAQLEKLFEHVDREHVLIVNIDDMKSDSRLVYHNVLKFLQLDNDGRTDFPRVNEAKKPGIMMLQKLLRIGDKVRRKLKLPRYGYNATVSIRKWNSQVPDGITLSQELKDEMLEYFESDIALLENITGFDLQTWRQ